MTDLINEMAKRMMSEMQEKREAFIKEMLTKKGLWFFGLLTFKL